MPVPRPRPDFSRSQRGSAKTGVPTLAQKEGTKSREIAWSDLVPPGWNPLETVVELRQIGFRDRPAAGPEGLPRTAIGGCRHSAARGSAPQGLAPGHVLDRHAACSHLQRHANGHVFLDVVGRHDFGLRLQHRLNEAELRRGAREANMQHGNVTETGGQIDGQVDCALEVARAFEVETVPAPLSLGGASDEDDCSPGDG